MDRASAGGSSAHRLSPPGPEGAAAGGPHRLAASGGTLVGRLVDDRVQVSLAQADGELLLTIWPGEYRARVNPLVLLDGQDQVVARGGEELRVSGGFLPSGDPRTTGHERVFCVGQILHGTGPR